jgi:hypothetical protein
MVLRFPSSSIDEGGARAQKPMLYCIANVTLMLYLWLYQRRPCITQDTTEPLEMKNISNGLSAQMTRAFIGLLCPLTLDP